MEKLNLIFDKMRNAFYQYTGAITSSFVLAISVILLIDYPNEEPFWLLKLGFTSGLAISLFYAISFIAQRGGNKLLLNLSVLIFLALYYFIILPPTNELFTDSYIFVVFPIFILSHLLVTVGPYLQSPSSENFWHFNKSLFINLFLTGIFTQVLGLGIILAILGVEHLFNIPIDGDIYAQIFFGISIIGSVLIFSLFSDKGLSDLESPRDYPQILKFFTQFILIPLLIIYSIILYAYTFKIIFALKIPRGWVAYLVLTYAVLGILAYLFVHPLGSDQKTKSWVSIFKNLFFFTLYPLIILLFIAIFIRITEYGFTEPRYFVLLLAIWLLGITIYFTFFRNPKLKTIPLSLFITGVLSLSLPFVNVFDVSVNSQKNEFLKILSKHGYLTEGKIDFSKPIKYGHAYDLNDKAYYLKERNHDHFISSFMNEKENKLYTDSNMAFMNIFMDIKEDSVFTEEANQSRYLYITSTQTLVNVREYQYMIIYKPGGKSEFEINGNILKITDSSGFPNKEFTYIDFKGHNLNLTEKFNEFVKDYELKKHPIKTEKIQFSFDNEDFKALITLPALSSVSEGNKKSYSYDSFTILVNLK